MALAKVDFVTDLYDSGVSKYDGYVTSIAVSDVWRYVIFSEYFLHSPV